MSSAVIQAVRGMNDILPVEASKWRFFENTVDVWLNSYGYQQIRLPIVEKTELFARSIGEITDIVEKEMYSFVDQLNGESLTLRPEGTASCVRAVIEHSLLYAGPQRLYYTGPMFRHERPQKGRYRQFHQVGVEALGFVGPDIDAEHIIMTARLWHLLGIDGVRLELNTLGSNEARSRYRARLIKYFEQHERDLDEDAKRRLHKNPLRILDSKNPRTQEIVQAAPKLLDDLDEQALQHFEKLQTLLRNAGVAFTINTKLVRGLDYYNFTVFEWITDRLGAQGTVCAGGRYDGLVEQIGGKQAPACGFAMGVERLLSLIDESKSITSVPDAYLVHQGSDAEAYAWTIAERLRNEQLHIIMHCGGGSFKSQMKKADASGARYALIIGDDEARICRVSVKPLRETTEQRSLELEELTSLLKRSDRTNPCMI